MNDPNREQVRHEVKFAAPAETLDWLETHLRTHSAAFRVAFPARRVNNLYFDSFDLHALSDNLAGVSQRRKLRLRWYGDDFQPARAQFEVKVRRNRLGLKRVHPVDGLPAFDRASWREISARVRAQLPDELRILFDAAPQPTLINHYRRRYYVSADERVRLTLDSDPVAYDQLLYGRPNVRMKTNLPPTLVVEAKFAPEHLDDARRAIEKLPLRLTRNSKYAIGVSSALWG